MILFRRERYLRGKAGQMLAAVRLAVVEKYGAISLTPMTME
jgi:hypothetical protein